MTLIAAAIHKHCALMATDTRVSQGGEPVEENAGKSAFVDSAEGRILIGCTGIAEINDQSTLDLIIKKVSDFDVGSKTITEVIERLREELTQTFGFTYGGRKVPALVVVIAGWNSGEARHPRVSKLSNIIHYEQGVPYAVVDFHVIEFDMPPERTLLVIDGDMRATLSKPFKAQQNQVDKLLKHHSNKFDEETMKELARLIEIASSDPASTTINDRVMVSRLTRKGSGIEYKYFPESPDYIAPGFVRDGISVSGITVKGDWVTGGKTVVGGDPSDFPIPTDKDVKP